MKSLKSIYVSVLLFLFTLLAIPLKSEAYVVANEEPVNTLDRSILDFKFNEDNQILHDGDLLHVSFKVKNFPIMKCIDVIFSNELNKRIGIPCYYSDSNGQYEGNLLLEPSIAEWKYYLSRFDFLEKNAVDPCETPKNEVLNDGITYSFVYSNNCYSGKHDLVVQYGNIKCQICGFITKNSKFELYSDKVTMCISDHYLTMDDLIKVKDKKDIVTSAKSTNEKVLCVVRKGIYDYVLIPKKQGKCKVAITMASGTQKTIDVIVNKGRSKVTIDQKTVVLKNGKTIKLKATRIPEAFYDNLSWSSSNSKVATVDKNGKVTAKSPGKTTIKVKSKYTLLYTTCTVTVIEPVKTISFTKQSLKLNKGKTYHLKLKITPKTSNEQLTYSSSNSSIVSVNKTGNIKAKKKGTVTITVKSKSGKRAKCKVKVK